jgi:hypothetical protein
MMMARFIGLRYFVVPDEANMFYRGGLVDNRREVFLSSVLVNSVYRARRNVIIAIQGVHSTHQLVFGKIGKRRDSLLATRTEDDIRSISVETWPFLNFVCNPEQQLIAVEWRSAPGFTVESLCRVLEEYATSRLMTQGYMVRLESLVRRNEFWRLVKDADVCSMRFTMTAPNFFGATAAAEDSLREISDVFNNTQTEIKLSNPAGKLRTPEGVLGKYTEYCDRGGGHWSVTVDAGGRRRSYKSTDRAIRINIDWEGPRDQEVLTRAIEKVVESACQLAEPSGP